MLSGTSGAMVVSVAALLVLGSSSPAVQADEIDNPSRSPRKTRKQR